MAMAHVQVRSEYLTAVGMDDSLLTLGRLLPEFGYVAGPPTRIWRPIIYVAQQAGSMTRF